MVCLTDFPSLTVLLESLCCGRCGENGTGETSKVSMYYHLPVNVVLNATSTLVPNDKILNVKHMALLLGSITFGAV